MPHSRAHGTVHSRGVATSVRLTLPASAQAPPSMHQPQPTLDSAHVHSSHHHQNPPSILLQLILALDYCHRRGVANRDIKLVGG